MGKEQAEQTYASVRSPDLDECQHELLSSVDKEVVGQQYLCMNIEKAQLRAKPYVIRYLMSFAFCLHRAILRRRVIAQSVP